MMTKNSQRFLRACWASGVAACLFLTAGCDKEAREALDELQSMDTGTEASTAVASTAMVVSVNGNVLTEGQLDLEMGRFLQRQPTEQLPPERLAAMKMQLRSEMIDRFVVQTLLADKANEQQIVVSAEQVSDALHSVTSRLPQGVTMESVLERSGISMSNFVADVENDLRIRRLIQDRTTNIVAATDEEAQAFYESQPQTFRVPEKAKARHVLIKCDSEADDATRAEKRKLAEDLQAQLAGGADFAEVAARHSECPSSKEGGDLGTFPRGQMVEPFDNAVFAQEVNTIGPVVETDFGFHVIEVLDRTPSSTQTFEQVREKVRDFLTNQKRAQDAARFVEELKQGAEIQYGGAAAPMPGFPQPGAAR